MDVLAIFAAATLVPFAIAYSFEKGWIYAIAVMVVIFLAASPFLIWAFLIIVYVIQPYFVACWLGTALGAMARQFRKGPDFTGPMTNPIWHGAIAGLVTYLLIAIPFQLLRSRTMGIAAMPDLQTAAKSALMAALWGSIAVAVFSRLRGPARVVAYTGGMALLVGIYSYVQGHVISRPNLVTPSLLSSSFQLLSMWTLMGLGQLGLLHLMRRHAGTSPHDEAPMTRPSNEHQTKSPPIRPAPSRSFGKR